MSGTVKIGFYKRNTPIEFVAYGEPVDGQPPPRALFFKDESTCRAMFVAMVGGSSTTGVRPVEFVASTVPGVVGFEVFRTI